MAETLNPIKKIDNNKKYVFIINPKSFAFDNTKIQNFINSIKSFFEEIKTNENVYDYYFYETKFPRDSINYLSKIILETPKTQIIRIFAVGGDGVLFDCLNGIMRHENCELANIPHGKTNDFLAGFDKSGKKFMDLQNQLSAPTELIDTINIGTNYAINMCVVGLEAEAAFWAYKFMKTHKKIFEKFPKLAPKTFALGGLMSLLNPQTRTKIYKIKIEDEPEIEGKFTTINIANNCRYGGQNTAVPEAVPNDGILNVLCTRGLSTLNGLRIISNYLKGKWQKYPDLFIYKKITKIEISANTPISINLDGEVFYDLNLNLKIVPKSVKFVTLNDIKSEK